VADKEGDAPGSHVLVLCTGDGGRNDGETSFPRLVAHAAKRGFRVEVWAWAHSLSDRFAKVAACFPDGRVTVRLLDEHRDRLVFRSGAAAPAEGQRTSPPASRASTSRRQPSPSAARKQQVAPAPAAVAAAPVVAQQDPAHVLLEMFAALLGALPLTREPARVEAAAPEAPAVAAAPPTPAPRPVPAPRPAVRPTPAPRASVAPTPAPRPSVAPTPAPRPAPRPTVAVTPTAN
jgi:hypothetical protein